MQKWGLGVALAIVVSCGTATASPRWHRADSPKAVRAREAMRATEGSGLPEWQGLLLMGSGLCAGSGFCVYRAARAKRTSGFADLFPTSGAMSRG